MQKTEEGQQKDNQRAAAQSLDLSKSQLEVLVQREEDPTVKVEIEETKSKDDFSDFHISPISDH